VQYNERKFHDGFGWVPKLRHCDGLYNKDRVYDYFRSCKGGNLCQEVCYKTRFSPDDQIYTKLSHLRMSDA
jgi:hypothetical protein